MDVKLRKDEKVRVLNGRSLYGIMLKILNRSSEIDQMKEHFWMVGLDPTHEILFIELLSLSKSESTTFDPIHIFNIAVHKSAVRVVMVHNSLTDEIAPTESDMKLTGKMGAIGLFLNIPVWDHLIITKKTYYSFLDAGTLDHLIENSDMPDAMKEIIIKRNLEENNVALTELRIIINMHKKGMDAIEIAEIVNVDVDEIVLTIRDFENGDLEEL